MGTNRIERKGKSIINNFVSSLGECWVAIVVLWIVTFISKDFGEIAFNVVEFLFNIPILCFKILLSCFVHAKTIIINSAGQEFTLELLKTEGVKLFGLSWIFAGMCALMRCNKANDSRKNDDYYYDDNYDCDNYDCDDCDCDDCDCND